MGIYVNPPADGFENIRNSEIYVDKSELILYTNRVMNTPRSLVCSSRPRRFGKSFAAKMLAAYYAYGADSAKLFDDLKAAQGDADLYRRHMNAYDVIFLDITHFISKAGEMRGALSEMTRCVVQELSGLYPEIGRSSAKAGDAGEKEGALSKEKENFSERVSEGRVADERQEESAELGADLFGVMTRISRRTGRKFYVIIDEWDAFFREAKEDEQLQRDYIRLLRGMFKSNLTPQVIAGAYITGILPIKKYGTQSALTDFREYTMLSPAPLSEYMGFTEDEVRDICQRTGLDFEEARRWYDGYRLDGAGHVYNPNSIMEASVRGRCSSYWTQTETYESLQIYIDMNYDGLKDGIVEMLGGQPCRIDTGSFQNDMTSIRCRDDVYTLLVHLGYLAYDPDRREVYIPNEEMREEFLRSIRLGHRTELVKAITMSERLLNATLSMDEEGVAGLIGEAHLSNTSPQHYNDEQALRSVVIMAYISSVDDYRRYEELAGGRGYVDLLFIPRSGSTRPAILVELKWNRSADIAVEQITSRGYVRAAQEIGYHGDILLVGINYSMQTQEHTCRIVKDCV